jgi:arylsulfatase
VPCAIRWPGEIGEGLVSNEIFSHTDMLPTLLAAAGEPHIVDKLKQGYTAGQKRFRACLDGNNLLPYLKGETRHNPRKGFLYWSDAGELMAVRVGAWKYQLQGEPAVRNLCNDPFEQGGVATADALLLGPAQAFVREFLNTFMEFPLRTRAPSGDFRPQGDLAVGLHQDHVSLS